MPLRFGVTSRTNQLEFPVRTLAFAPDGALMAVGGKDPMVRVYTGRAYMQMALELGPHQTTVLGLLFLSGSRLVSASGSGVFFAAKRESVLRLWDTRTGRLLWRRALPGQPTALASHPDGASLLVGDSVGRVQILSLSTGEVVGSLSAGRQLAVRFLRDVAHQGTVGGISVFGDGHVVTASKGRLNLLRGLEERNDVCLWDAQSRRLIKAFRRAKSERYVSVAVSPEGDLLLLGCAERGEVEVWLTESLVSGAFR